MEKSKKCDNIRSRNFKLLLYPDNERHLRAMDIIQADYPCYIGIKHHLLAEDGKEILTGEGKLHYHYALCFENPVFQVALCKKLGLVRDDGDADTQFCREIKGRLSDFLLYLTHVKYDDKEHYQVSDLFGSPDLIKKTEIAILAYQRKDCDMRDAVCGCLAWIELHTDKIISWRSFAAWVVNTPYFRAANNSLVRLCIDEHNQKIISQRNADHLKAIQDGYAALSARDLVPVDRWGGEKY